MFVLWTHFAMQSTARKKIAPVYFTAILFEPGTADRHLESHIFCKIRPCTNNIVYGRLGGFRTFLYVL